MSHLSYGLRVLFKIRLVAVDDPGMSANPSLRQQALQAALTEQLRIAVSQPVIVNIVTSSVIAASLYGSDPTGTIIWLTVRLLAIGVGRVQYLKATECDVANPLYRRFIRSAFIIEASAWSLIGLVIRPATPQWLALLTVMVFAAVVATSMYAAANPSVFYPVVAIISVGNAIGVLTHNTSFSRLLFGLLFFAVGQAVVMYTLSSRSTLAAINGRLDSEELSASLEEQRVTLQALATDLESKSQSLESANLRLEESNRDLQEFAYVASHDLQEPLRKIQAFGSRLEKKHGDKLGEEGLDFLNRMSGAASRMSTLIDDLLTFSRVATKVEPFRTTNLNDVLTGVLSDLEVAIDRQHAVVICDGLPTIDVDPLQMRQLFQNLLGNALKFTSPDRPPKISIHTENDDDPAKVRVLVSDNGIGFSPEHADKIFNVFQRLHGREQYSGSGVGLSVCRRILERHSGSIRAVGRLGEGATFVATLPRKQATQENVSPTKSPLVRQPSM
jgi:signal transduction histidine kinase